LEVFKGVNMNYIEFVSEQLEIFQKKTNLLSSNHEITPMLLNKNLAEYSNVGIALNAEYTRAEGALEDFKRTYNAWWDERFINMRHELNPISLAATKWASKGEIEAETRVKYKDEFYDWDTRLKDYEMKVNFLSRLRGQWEKHVQVIICLSQNARQEMMYLPTESIRRERAVNTN